MHIEKLSLKQIKILYTTQLKKAYVKSELKPWRTIKNLVNEGNYQAVGLFNNNEMLATAFLLKKNDRNILIDYFSVFPKYRHAGNGSEFLSLIKEHYSSYNNILAEVETEEVNNSDAKYCRTKRLDFYYKNGFEKTGYKVDMFGNKLYLLRIKNKENDDDLFYEFSALYFLAYPEKVLNNGKVKIIKDTTNAG